MIERIIESTQTNDKTIERLISDDNVDINHMMLPYGAELPLHHSNSNVYMLVIRGSVSLRLNGQEEHCYSKGTIINIPYNTLMNVYNNNEDTLEIYVVKSPSPKHYIK